MSGGYTSAFARWETHSSVRNRPRRVLDDPDDHPVFFPPEFVPAVSHPLVVARGPATTRRILLHSLYQYLHFTTVLEQTAVLPVTGAIALNRGGLDLPERMRADAFKITTDEAWHAQICYDFTAEVARRTGVAAGAVVGPAFERRLRQARDDTEPGLRPLLDLVFAVVSETLVSSLLAGIPRDTRLPEPVRKLVADHAADEGRHHSYFRGLLRVLWPRLSAAERRLIGPSVPDMIRTFLHPDLDAVAAILAACGFTRAETPTILADSYPPESPLFDIAHGARATVQSFREVGALGDPRTRDSFAAAGL